jgi:hypothetical protein
MYVQRALGASLIFAEVIERAEAAEANIEKLLVQQEARYGQIAELRSRAESAEAEAMQLRKMVELRDRLIAELRVEIMELDPS